MSDFLDEDSPWAQPSLSGDRHGLSSAFDDGATPWGAPNDVSDEDPAEEQYNPYASDPYGDENVPLASAASIGPEAADPVPGNEPVEGDHANENENEPVLKPQSHKTARAGRKKRSGGIKVERVSGADPLVAVAAQNKDEFTDISLARSTADLRLTPQSEGPSGDGPLDAAASSTHESSLLSQPASTPDPAPAPEFEISVSDPSMVGPVTSPHTVYTVHMSTTSDAYETKEASVQRRYRDFRWIYHMLEQNHPGVIVPPPPEKQAVGRFNDEFVQQRRSGLEQMLKKIVAHKRLVTDPDLEAFLTSMDFAEYLKSRTMGDDELERTATSVVSLGDFASGAASGGSGGGLIGSLSGSLGLSRANEADPWTVDKRQYLDGVETQLRAATRALASVGAQRQHLSDTVADFANVTRALVEVEPTRRLTVVLRAFAKVHERLSQLYARQKQQDLLTLEATLDEHLRVVNSTRNVLVARQRVFSTAEQAGAELEKRQVALDRLQRQGRTQEDRQLALEAEVSVLSDRAGSLHQQAADIAHLVESEISRVEHEKMVEFRNSVEVYLETAVESQKEAIEIWETFYSRYFASEQAASA